jgi:hypothetical protein
MKFTTTDKNDLRTGRIERTEKRVKVRKQKDALHKRHMRVLSVGRF